MLVTAVTGIFLGIVVVGEYVYTVLNLNGDVAVSCRNEVVRVVTGVVEVRINGNYVVTYGTGVGDIGTGSTLNVLMVVNLGITNSLATYGTGGSCDTG